MLTQTHTHPANTHTYTQLSIVLQAVEAALRVVEEGLTAMSLYFTGSTINKRLHSGAQKHWDLSYYVRCNVFCQCLVQNREIR